MVRHRVHLELIVAPHIGCNSVYADLVSCWVGSKKVSERGAGVRGPRCCGSCSSPASPAVAVLRTLVNQTRDGRLRSRRIGCSAWVLLAWVTAPANTVLLPADMVLLSTDLVPLPVDMGLLDAFGLVPCRRAVSEQPSPPPFFRGERTSTTITGFGGGNLIERNLLFNWVRE